MSKALSVPTSLPCSPSPSESHSASQGQTSVNACRPDCTYLCASSLTIDSPCPTSNVAAASSTPPPSPRSKAPPKCSTTPPPKAQSSHSHAPSPSNSLPRVSESTPCAPDLYTRHCNLPVDQRSKWRISSLARCLCGAEQVSPRRLGRRMSSWPVRMRMP